MAGPFERRALAGVRRGGAGVDMQIVPDMPDGAQAGACPVLTEDAMHDDVTNLHARLSNCLQTILDLEGDLDRLELGDTLMSEFSLIKSFINRVKDVALQESDVARIEKATANFLDEVRGPLSLLHNARTGKNALH